MSSSPAPRAPVLFLALECRWPPHSGAGLRSWGILHQLSERFDIEAIVASRRPPDAAQKEALSRCCRRVDHVLLPDRSAVGAARTVAAMFCRRLPYHCASLWLAFRNRPELVQRVHTFPGTVFTSVGHWGVLCPPGGGERWILNQCDADIAFWHSYARQTGAWHVKAAALANWAMARRFFPPVYRRVARVVSVCAEDRDLTLAAAPEAHVSVIPNGVDCGYLTPVQRTAIDRPRVLFTGTSARRNVEALRDFTARIMPRVREAVPDVELLVGGNFSASAQRGFRESPGVRFTGRVPDMRPVFGQSDVFIAPFRDAHGSKLKIAEAMAMAMAIVTTPEGVRGFPLRHGASALVAGTDREFAECVVRLLRDPIERAALGRRARALAEAELHWPRLGERLEALVGSVAKSDRNGLTDKPIHGMCHACERV